MCGFTQYEVVNTTTFSEVIGFEVVISDQLNNSYSHLSLNPTIRFYEFNSTEVDKAGLVGNLRTVAVAVVTAVGMLSSSLSMISGLLLLPIDIDNNDIMYYKILCTRLYKYKNTFLSVKATMTDTSPTLTERQCIEVSINSYCNESADMFQAQIQYAEGTCDRNGTEFTSTNNYTLYENYRQCVPIIKTGNICYSARVFHDGRIVGSTKVKQLTLLPCRMNTLQESGVIVSTVQGRNGPREVVPHNTAVEIWCYDFSILNRTRCANGTFVPLVTNGIHTACSEGML